MSEDKTQGQEPEEQQEEPTAEAAVPLYEHSWNHTTLSVAKRTPTPTPRADSTVNRPLTRRQTPVHPAR